MSSWLPGPSIGCLDGNSYAHRAVLAGLTAGREVADAEL